MNCKEVKDEIQKFATEEQLKPLSECKDTIMALKEESEKDNPYIILAKRFKKYNDGYEETSTSQDAINDWMFYNYLSNLPSQFEYTFSFANNESITVYIDLLNPYVLVENQEFIHPRWHLLVSFHAYRDAIYNHSNDEYVSQIDFKPARRYMAKTLKTWVKEAIK